MPDAKALDAYYKALTDQELLRLTAEGGFTNEAEQALRKELAHRNLTADEAKRCFDPEWLAKAKAGSVSVLVLESGERITVEVVGFDENGDGLAVTVISPESLPRTGHRKHRTISFQQIVSFEPQPHLMEQWPFSDRCQDRTFSLPRFALMTTIFLCLIVGSLPLFLLLTRRPYGLQEASMVSYTLFELFFTFARTGSRGGRDLPPFRFKCPAVRPQIPRLLWRHLGFLIALIVLQTAMLAIQPNLPDWWNVPDKKGSTAFDLALMLICLGLGYVQVYSNRSVLDRAHREFSA
jgi:hypothetical protein